MKRFYREAGVEPRDGGWQVALDGRPVRTQGGGKPQVVPSRALADTLAAEWQAQGATIDPRGFPARDMADYAIDMVAADPAPVIAKLLAYAETDTLCYRADPDDRLWHRQQEMWEPLVAALEAREGIRLERVSGIVHRANSPQAEATLRRRLEQLDPFALAALETLASLAASLTIGLAALEPGADGEALWNAANLEEDWQIERWGADEEAADRRERRSESFLAAMAFAGMARA